MPWNVPLRHRNLAGETYVASKTIYYTLGAGKGTFSGAQELLMALPWWCSRDHVGYQESNQDQGKASILPAPAP